MSLYKLDGDHVAPDKGDVLLWQGSGSALVGIEGPGIVPSIDKKEIELDSGIKYFIEVDTSKNLVDTDSFTKLQLLPDKVRVNRKNVPEDDFLKQAPVCGG